jgi:hypothetical protein
MVSADTARVAAAILLMVLICVPFVGVGWGALLCWWFATSVDPDWSGSKKVRPR